MENKKYDTILFDLDGTLLDTLVDLMNSVNYAEKEFGNPELSYEKIRSIVGHGIRNLVMNSTPEGYDNPKFEEIFKAFQEHYAQHNQDFTAPYDGIMDLLDQLSTRGIKMAIVTNKNQSNLDALCRDIFKGKIPVAVGDNMKRAKKPDPEPVLEAIRQVKGLKSLEEAKAHREGIVYIGDSEVDAETAENSELDYILVTYGFRDREVLEQFNPIAIIDRPEDILDFV